MLTINVLLYMHLYIMLRPDRFVWNQKRNNVGDTQNREIMNYLRKNFQIYKNQCFSARQDKRVAKLWGGLMQLKEYRCM